MLKDYLLGTVASEYLRAKIRENALYIVYMFVVQLFAVFTFTTGCIMAGESITNNIRSRYVRALLQQNIAFLETYGSGKITTHINTNTAMVQDAVSHKIGLLASAISSFVAAYTIGFIKHWKLTLVLTSAVVAISAVMVVMATKMGAYEKESASALTDLSGRTEEIFGGIRVVKSMAIEQRLAQDLEPYLERIKKWSTNARHALAWLLAFIFAIIFLNYGLAIWQGNRFMKGGDGNVGSIITVLLALNVGAFFFGNVGPQVQAMVAGVTAAHELFAVIERESPIKMDGSGDVLDPMDTKGEISFSHISHIFPNRPEVPVIQDLSINFPARKVTALVGASGCGKSTLLSLLMRFYDPVAGQIFFDGQDITKLNLPWLRSQIAIVSQDTTLFNESIFTNIAYGLGMERFENETQEVKRKLVKEACRLANAHDFIMELPNGYDQIVGIRGGTLSGGQKQRISIARAIVADPTVLLLDEATSALDVQAEEAVQKGLASASAGRTTIIVAHRLSTVKSADNIVVMAAGKVVEQGTHRELVDADGAYNAFVRLQELKQSSSAHSDDIKKTVPNDAASPGNGSRNTKSGKTDSPTADPTPQTLKSNDYSLWQAIAFVAAFNREDWILMTTGTLSAIVAGAMWPVHSVFFAKAIIVLSLGADSSPSGHDASFWASMYIMLAFVQLLSQGIQGSAYAICSERLIFRARRQAIRHLLRQDVVFFDDSGNSSGVLTGFVSSDVKALSGLSGVFLGTVFSAITTVAGGLALGLALGWKLALVSMVTIPVIMVSGYYRLNLVAVLEQITHSVHENSAGHICEVTNAIKTVAALGLARSICENYTFQLQATKAVAWRATFKSSLLYAFADALPFACMALGFWYGGMLVLNNEYTPEQFFIILLAVIFGSTSAGLVFAYAPDFSKATTCARTLKHLMEKTPEIDIWSDKGEVVDKDGSGDLQMKHVSFAYPGRSADQALSDINLSAGPGKQIALCGMSGSGKSTIIGLLERFYSPTAGAVLLNNREAVQFKLSSYRSQFSLVSQEPLLFSLSIRDNLLYGSLDPASTTEQDLIAACQKASIYEFISSLPDGLATICGSNATLLSGGQKQRISIA